jgi:hypothetical protein
MPCILVSLQCFSDSIVDAFICTHQCFSSVQELAQSMHHSGTNSSESKDEN